MIQTIQFTLNDEERRVETDPATTVLELLRETFHLTGTKQGCGAGECGACTVIVNKKAVNACLLVAGQLEGAEVFTVEGLEKDGELDAVQQAFLDEHAVQCGFCTPGMLMSAKALLLNNPNPSKEEISVAMSGNLCRCTGYQAILRAVETAARNA